MSVRERRLQHLANEGFHEVAYREWGDPNNDRVLICVHGISRSGRDFDDFAAAMSDKYRVLCPDMPGRGSSAWFQDKSLYVQSSAMMINTFGLFRSAASTARLLKKMTATLSVLQIDCMQEPPKVFHLTFLLSYVRVRWLPQ